MGEAMVVRRGSAGSDISFANVLKTEIIETNQSWIAPVAINQSFSVRIFGGGGGGNHWSGGGGGFMNNNIFTINAGTKITVLIGRGSTSNGGTTSFGNYLSANGGSCGDLLNGGNGGSGGGGSSSHSNSKGGVGYQFGGGGGTTLGGNGGYWGGGGGCTRNTPSCSTGGVNYYDMANLSLRNGRSGFGGNGGTGYNSAENGTNTKGLNLDFMGIGKAGGDSNGYCGGGGGYGGNGGTPSSSVGGGGGGYGANGGGLGGGGGYGAVGNSGGGGYGPYGKGGGICQNGGIAAGGGAWISNAAANVSGGNGICIIQYYI